MLLDLVLTPLLLLLLPSLPMPMPMPPLLLLLLLLSLSPPPKLIAHDFDYSPDSQLRRLITNAGHNTRRVGSGDSLDGNQDHQVDDASYALDCPSYSPWHHGRTVMDPDVACKLQLNEGGRISKEKFEF